MTDKLKGSRQKSKFWRGGAFLILLALSFSFYGAAPAAASAEEEGILVVKLNDSSRYESLQAMAVGPVERLFGEVYRLRAADSASVLANLRGQEWVTFAEPDRAVRAEMLANDPVFTTDGSDLGKQWYLPKMEVQQAWEKTRGSGVIVAVVDTGIDGRHEDLSDGRVIGGYLQYCQVANADGNDCLVRNSGEISPGINSDDNGHGTIIAGIIGAIPNNNRGIAGINWDVRLMPIKALDSQGSGFASDVAQGMRWAVDHGAKIINLSIGGPGLQGAEVIQEAVTYAYNHGALVVAAAGNDSAVNGENLNITPTLPVCSDGGANMVVGVAATDVADRKARFSNYGGNCVDIAAPGAGTFVDRKEKQGLISTYYDPARPGENDIYVRALGTSVAAPMVSGVAALAISMFPDLSLPALRDRLLSSVDNIDIYNTTGCGSGSCVGQIGRGRLNAYKAVTASEAFATGTVLRDASGRVYLVENGVKRPVSAYVLSQRFSGTTPILTTQAQLDIYPTGLPLPPADSAVLKSSDSALVFFVENSVLRPISYLGFVSRGLRFENVAVLSAAEVNSYQIGAEALVANGALVKTKDNPAVYILNNGVRQLLSHFVFRQRGFDGRAIGELSPEELNRYPLDPGLYPPRDTTLLRGDRSATVYVIEAGQRRGLNLAAFQNRGYNFTDVQVLSQSEVEGYELGNDIIQ